MGLIRTNRAKRELALKLVLEDRFKTEVRSYFKTIVNDFRGFYTSTGMVIENSSFRDDTKEMIKKQYRRVSRHFKNDMRDSDKKASSIGMETKKVSEINEAVDIEIAMFIAKEAPARGVMIDNTTKKNMEASVSVAVQGAIDEGQSLNNVVIASVAADLLTEKFKGREEAISMSETQFPAERTKIIEASVVGISLLLLLKKQWSSILDSKTRARHAVADGQTVPINDPFVVAGELLKYPSDTSLGASAANVVRCRCSSQYKS